LTAHQMISLILILLFDAAAAGVEDVDGAALTPDTDGAPECA